MQYDKIIIGAGLYGLYSAERCGRRGEHVLVLEHDEAAFKRATFINQARVHKGYHYPRSFSTAIKSAGYFRRFNEDYGFCILNKFDQVYATSANFSWSNAEQFKKFCRDADIRCDEVAASRYFQPGMCDGAFLTEEYTYDAQVLKQYFLDRLAAMPNVEIVYGSRIDSIEQDGGNYRLEYHTAGDDRRQSATAPFVLNSTYASVNQVNRLAGFDDFKIKYELCEIILCNVSPELHDTGLTVMDGPFFSIMPFGKTGYHSLTSVTFTPHKACKQPLPEFACQKRSGGFCSPSQLGNCNDCPAQPQSAWPYMSNLARKYMRPELKFDYDHSLFSMKPILLASEIDDSRPTVIKVHHQGPTFVSVLSGKINTVYDLDDILDNGQ